MGGPYAWIITLVALMFTRVALLEWHVTTHHTSIRRQPGGAREERPAVFNAGERRVVVGAVLSSPHGPPSDSLSVATQLTDSTSATLRPTPVRIDSSVNAESTSVPLHAFCPMGYALEEYDGDPDHGDVCRGPDLNFVCPPCCTAMTSAPWCVSGDKNGTDSCQADAQFASCFQRAPDVMKATATITCPPDFSPLLLSKKPAKSSSTSTSDGLDIVVCMHKLRRRRWECPVGWSVLDMSPFCQPPSTRAPEMKMTPPPGTKWTLAAVLRTWHVDADLGMAALQSLIKHVPFDRYTVEVVVITDNASSDVVNARFSDAKLRGAFAGPDGEVPAKLVIEDAFLNDGHIQQKYSKLTADLHTEAEFILHIDSDLRYHKWDDACFFNAISNKPILEYTPYSTFLERSQFQWRAGTAAMLKLPTQGVEHEFSRSNQHVYPRALYGQLREFLEKSHNKSFRALFTDTPLVGTGGALRAMVRAGVTSAILVSDFNLIGAFAHYFAPGAVHEINTVENGYTATSCVSQCNSRMYTHQCCMAWFKSMDEFQHSGATPREGRPLSDYDCNTAFIPIAKTSCPRVKANASAGLHNANAVRYCTPYYLKPCLSTKPVGFQGNYSCPY